MTSMSTETANILMVEDNEKILAGNMRMFMWEGYTVETATTLKKASEHLAEHKPDIIILDLMLPDGNGLEFIKDMKQSEYRNIPILVLTGLGTQADMINGLSVGADDYLAKPYDFPVLLARTQALLRRCAQLPEIISRGALELDLVASVATIDGVNILLTQKEFAVLLIFMQNMGKTVTANYIYEKVWQMPFLADNNALKSTIKRLRSKLSSSEYAIEWLRDEGYTFTKL